MKRIIFSLIGCLLLSTGVLAVRAQSSVQREESVAGAAGYCCRKIGFPCVPAESSTVCRNDLQGKTFDNYRRPGDSEEEAQKKSLAICNASCGYSGKAASSSETTADAVVSSESASSSSDSSEESSPSSRTAFRPRDFSIPDGEWCCTRDIGAGLCSLFSPAAERCDGMTVFYDSFDHLSCNTLCYALSDRVLACSSETKECVEQPAYEPASAGATVFRTDHRDLCERECGNL